MRNIHVCGNPFQCTHITNNGNSNHQFEQCCSVRASPSPSPRSSRRCWNRTPQPRWDDMNVRVNPTIDICDPWGGGVDVHGQRRSGSRVVCSTAASAANVCDHPNHDDEMLIVPPQHSSISVIDLNWLETPSAHILKADVPGLRKEDLSISIEGEVVKIRGQRTLDYFSNCLNKQLTWYIPFRRQFVLPPNVISEDIRAVLDHGVLTITVPKIPIVPSIAWFIPVDRSPSPPRELQPNFINIQYERDPDLSSSFNEGLSTPRLRISPVSPRARSLSESNVSFVFQDDPTSSRSASSPSTPKIQNIIVRKPASLAAVLCEEEASSSQQQHTIDIPGPSSSPKCLSIVQEDGKKPNAHVTLNININTGKIVGGESNSNRSGGAGGASIDHDLGDEDYGRNFRDSGTGNNSSFSSSPAPSRSSSALRQRPSRVQFDDDFGNDRQRYSSQFDFPFPSGPPRGSRRPSRSSSVDPGDQDLDSEGFELAPRDRYLEQAADEENAPDSSASTPGRSRPSVSRSRTSSVQQQQDDEEMDAPPAPSPPQRKSSIRGIAEESAEDDGRSSPAPRKRSSASSSPPKEERFKGRAISRRMTTADIDDSGSQNPEPQLPRRKTEGDSPSNREPLQAARGSRKLSEAPTAPNRRKSSKAEAPANEETDGRRESAKPVDEDASKSAPSASRKNSRRASQAAPPSTGSETLTKKEKEVLKKRASLPLQPRRKSSAADGQGGPKANEKKRNSSSAGAGAKRPTGSRRASEAPQEEAGEITNRRSFEKRKSKRPDDDMGP